MLSQPSIQTQLTENQSQILTDAVATLYKSVKDRKAKEFIEKIINGKRYGKQNSAGARAI